MTAPSASRIVVGFLRHQKAALFTALFWRFAAVIAPMQIPLVTGALIDVLAGDQLRLYGFNMMSIPAEEAILIVTGILAGLALLAATAAYCKSVSTAKLSRNFVSHLRRRMTRCLVDMPLERQHELGGGELMDRVLSDTKGMRTFIEKVLMRTIVNVLRVVYPVFMLLALDVTLAAIALGVLIPQFVISHFLQNRLHGATRTARTSRSALTESVKETVDGMETLRSIDARGAVLDRLDDRIGELERDELTSKRFSGLVSSNVQFMTKIGVAGVWAFGAYRVLGDTLSVGGLVAFVGYTKLAYKPFEDFTSIASSVRKALVSLERISDLLKHERPDEPEAEVDWDGGGDLPPLGVGHLRLAGVSYSYDGNDVLVGVRGEFHPGELTVVTGRSGSGKSTMLRILGGLHAADDGKILLDDRPIDEMPRSALRQLIALVPQHPTFFNGTIAENLRLASPDATDDDLRAACRQVDLLAEIDALPDGLETRLGKGAGRLSGGQQHRMALARALVSKPVVLMLDEPTAALDAGTEEQVLRTISRLAERMTVIMAAHRSRPIESADRVLLLEGGRLMSHSARRRPHGAPLIETMRHDDAARPASTPGPGPRQRRRR